MYLDDVVGKLWKKNCSEDRILFLARWFIFLGGTASLLLSIDPPANVLFFGADIWGVFAAVLTPLIYGMFVSKRGTKKGACAAFLVGLVSSICVVSNVCVLQAKYPEAQIIVDAACTAGLTGEMNEKVLDVMENIQVKVTNR